MMNRAMTGILAAILVGLVAALYGQFLSNPIVLDDIPFFVMDGRGNQPVSGYHYALFELRSLPYATLAWSKAALGLSLHYFRIENLLLHAATVLALFFFLKSLFETVLANSGTSGLRPVAAAFLAALMFALHPVATYAVGYLVQRTIVMATLFGVLAMLAYLHGCIRQRMLWAWVSVVFYFLAAYSKEHVIMLPAVLLAMTVLLFPDWRGRLRRNWSVFAAFAGIAVMVLLARKGILGSVYEPSAPMMLVDVGRDAYLLSVLTQSWLFFKYVALWLLPNPEWMSIDMREPFAQSFGSLYLLAFIAFIGWGGGAIWLLLRRGRRGLLGFAMLFPWLMFMTEFSAVRIQEPFVLYRSYLWAVCIGCLVPLLFARATQKIAYLVGGLVAVTFFVISMDRLGSMSHPILLWDDAAKLVDGRSDLPGLDRIYNNRGVALLKEQRYKPALADFRRALALTPELPSAYTNIGAIYLDTGEPQKAVEAFSQAIDILMKFDRVYDDRPFYGRAIAYERLGKMQEAKKDYEVSCKIAYKGCNKL